MQWPPDASGSASAEVELTRIRPETDVTGLFRALDDPAVWEHIPGGRPDSSAEFQGRLQPFAYLLSLNTEPVGTSSYILNEDHPRDIEIGATLLATRYWGTELNRTVKTRMIETAFAAGAEHVRFRTDERNHRSASAIRKIGAQDAGTKLEEWMRRDGTQRTSLLFTLDPSQWGQAPT